MNDNDMRGAIWGNQRKEKDTHPDFTGTAMIDGKEYFINAWKRKPDASDRAPALSFSFKAKEVQQDQAQYTNAKPVDASDVNDSIPF